MVTRTVREASVTRSVSEEVPLIAGRTDERWGVYCSSLVDTSGYHFLLPAASSEIGNAERQQVMATRTVREALVTRSVSEEDPD